MSKETKNIRNNESNSLNVGEVRFFEAKGNR